MPTKQGNIIAALITLWEAADRICGKRLEALIPTLIDSMTRHGHLSLPKDLRQRLKQISAATIGRLLRDVHEQAFCGQRRRAGGIGNAIRRAVPTGPSLTRTTRYPVISR
ncbi:hypothetical protein [Caballeronia sp. INML2]|uniref:hypothetical protein n=1 Tax=Caballeronia sp. INML2 TaxID=2921748 RepID=UPI002029370D|nr:hypothetical protein [Caballeronia sp. INML2]